MSKIAKFKGKTPTPMEVGLTVPKSFNKELFEAGFQHGLVSNRLDKIEQFKASFREGFRAAKLYLRAYYKDNNISVIPMKARMKFKVKD